VDRPNVLVVMTDQERYPPPYEVEAMARFRRERQPARAALADGGVSFHRHYVGATACLPSRTTLFTGQYPSLHGGVQTDGLAKHHTDPAMSWLDPASVPTLGDWFRAGGYRSFYRGKWHISHADLVIPGTHRALMGTDDDGRLIPANVDAYRRADRLDGFGFSGWVGREPHGALRADAGIVRDAVFADQVTSLFAELAQARTDGPWLTVASLVNPHDIAFGAFGWEHILMQDAIPDSVPDIPAPPSRADSFADRPRCQEEWRSLWPAMIFDQEPEPDYRRLYHHLHVLVDRAIAAIVEGLDTHGLADDTIVVLTSDHGDLLGSHGGLVQKWYNAFDETTRVPLVVTGPGVASAPGGYDLPTSHVDLVPTLLGLADIDVDAAAAVVGAGHTEVHPLPGRDLSGVIRGSVAPETVAEPVYFMTEDDISRGLHERNALTGEPFTPIDPVSKVESVVTTLATGADGSAELWKLNHYYERIDAWHAERGIAPNPFEPPPGEPFFELHNLTRDPEERANLAGAEVVALSRMRTVLEEQRDAKRLLPRHRNPAA
jgi:arylsulfatase A-like enzyme